MSLSKVRAAIDWLGATQPKKPVASSLAYYVPLKSGASHLQTKLAPQVPDVVLA
ncbi:MAG: hypothetical protein QOH84_2519 [Kribbellaceae bacterium]|nr:hypothetical protein [Kribbellaceae bacterium]